MTVLTKINGMEVRETYPEDATTPAQWNELAEMVAQVLSGKK